MTHFPWDTQIFPPKTEAPSDDVDSVEQQACYTYTLVLPHLCNQNNHPLFCVLEASAPLGMSISSKFWQPSQRKMDVFQALLVLPSLYTTLQLPTGGPLT